MRRKLLLLAVLVALPVRWAIGYQAAVDPNLVLVDNFDGWGTSLCWWANVVGGYANRGTYANLAFSQLKLNIVRYNIGGGENPALTNSPTEYRARMAGFEPNPGVWNWNADANQRWMLGAAVARGADRVVAFANSPPYWMTVSGSVTGSTNGTSNNLQTAYEDDFAIYLATVLSNLTVLDGITFESATPVNEPAASWWKYGGRQEGCHTDSAQQARLVNLLRSELNARNLPAGIVASEDSDEQSTINSINGYDVAARSNVFRIVTHTYGANNPTGVRNLAASLRKPLWVSEYGDGDGTGLQMARRIRDDIATMWARAWVYWQVVDNAGGWGFLYNALDGSGNITYSINKKFYVMGQFSQYIRPGCRILSVADNNSLAAWHPTNRTLTIVTVNDSTNSFDVAYDLGAFATLPGQAAAIRTSAGENQATLPAITLTNRQLAVSIPAQSVTTLVLSNVTPAAPSAEPWGWYPLEASALDATGHGYNGSISNHVTFVPGKLGSWAAQFDGVDGFIQIPLCISNHFTIAFWVRTTQSAAIGQWWNGRGLVDGEVSGSVSDFGVALVGTNVGFGIGNPDTTILSTTAINDGQWHHVAATRDAVSGQMQLFIDGGLQASGFGPVGARTAPPSLRLGSIQPGYAGGFFAGALDDVELFGRVFSAAEIGQLMNHAPVMTPSAGASIVAGQTLVISNTATDPDLPAQALTWSLLSAPVGAFINPANGLLTWRPTLAQSPSTNILGVVVSDNGSPSLGATQTLTVIVSRPAAPRLSEPAFVAGQMQLRITGDVGPDYVVEAATNIVSPYWLPLATYFAASPPLLWTDPTATNWAQRYYRVRLAP